MGVVKLRSGCIGVMYGCVRQRGGALSTVALGDVSGQNRDLLSVTHCRQQVSLIQISVCACVCLCPSLPCLCISTSMSARLLRHVKLVVLQALHSQLHTSFLKMKSTHIYSKYINIYRKYMDIYITVYIYILNAYIHMSI